MIVERAIEGLAKKNVSLRKYSLDNEAEVLEGKEAIEVSTKEALNIDFIEDIGRLMPAGYSKIIIDTYDDETVVEYIKVL